MVKGIKFKNIKDAGDPVDLAALYNQQGADELTFLDIGASYRSREIMIEVVEKVSSQVFIPLTVGGGIREVADMRRILNAGADKVAICTAAIKILRSSPKEQKNSARSALSFPSMPSEMAIPGLLILTAVG